MKAFLEVARYGSFQTAAENLHITQSTVSARIKVLEEQLRTPLFDRKRDGSELTTAGKNFIRYAKTAVRSWEQAKQEITLPEGLDALISLGVQINLWEKITPAWIEQMQIDHPEIGTRVIMEYSESLLAELSYGSLDLTLTYICKQGSDISSELLMQDTLVLVATAPRKVKTGWVPDYVFVDWGYEFRDAHNKAYPDTQAPRLSVSLGMVGLDYILKYGGAGYFPSRMIQRLVDEKSLYYVEDAPTFSRPVYLSYLNNSSNKELLELAISSLKKVVDREYQ